MGNAVSHCEPERIQEAPTKVEDEEEEPTQQDAPEGEGSEGGEAEGEGEEEEAPKPEITLETSPYDPRFPSTNQARNCYTRYNEFHRCAAEKGEEDDACRFYQRSYRSICPGEWVERWNEQRDAGTWPGKY